MKKIYVTDQDIQEYRRDGIVTFGSILTRNDLVETRKHIKEKIANLPPDIRPEQMDMCHVDDPFLLKLCSDKRILDVIEQFIGPDIVLFASHLISKSKGNGLAIPWHQDATFWPLNPMKVITLWLAIDDSTLENGCMRVVPGTHRAGQLIHEVPEAPDEGFLFHERLQNVHIEESKAIDVVLTAGKFSLHDHYIIHGSNPNTSRKRRCGYTMRFMPVTTKLDRLVDHPLYLLRGKDISGVNSYVNVS